MGNKGLLIILITGFFVFSLVGCATMGNRGEDFVEGPEGPMYKSLEVASLLRFDDVPVPSGFRIMNERSFTFQNDYTRVGLLRYLGNINTDRVVAFYKDQMSLFNWEMVNLIEYDTRMLIFEKEGESCVITANPNTANSTILTIHIAPKATEDPLARMQSAESKEK